MKFGVCLLVVLLALVPVGALAQEGMSVDYESIYREVLDGYCALIAEGDERYAEMDGAIGVMEITGALSAEEGMDAVGYYIVDVNGDGIKELMVGEAGWESNGRICAVYTCVDGIPVCVAEGWARSRYYLTEDGRFFYEGSGGATRSAFGEYVLESDALVCELFYFTEPDSKDFERVNVYRNHSGVWDAQSAQRASAAEFNEEQERLSMKIVPLNYTSLSEYVHRPTVRAAWGADVLPDGSAYIGYAADRSEYESIVVFLTDERVTDFRLMTVEFTDVTEEGEFLFSAQEFYRLDELTKELPLAVITTFYGDMSGIGIAYVDADGEEKVFDVSVSGYDGSLIMTEIQLID